jgi:transcriptional regulator with XRE-family HTH domain
MLTILLTKGKNTMLTIEQIKIRLSDRNLSAVAKKTGLSRQTISGIANGTAQKPSYETVKILSDYLEASDESK